MANSNDKHTPANPWAQALASSAPHEAATGMERSRAYWRSMADLVDARDDETDREFPEGTSAPFMDMDRRDLFKLLGASMALAGMGGCLPEPGEEILPYTDRPPEITPGVPLQYATSMVLDGFATGILVQAREGRPIKVEGNPDHPASLGASGVLEQASVLQLYDPNRARAVRRYGVPRSWFDFFDQVTAEAAKSGLWFLLYPQSSPLVADLMARVRQRHPGARFAFYAPLERRAAYAGASQVFGRALDAHYDFQRADVVVALDADFTARMPNSLRWARDFATRRRLSSPTGTMNRLYMVEAMPSSTGTLADHRLRVRSGDIAHLAARILAALMNAGVRPPGMPQEVENALQQVSQDEHADWLAAVVRDLIRTRGASIVIAGDGQPAETHAIAHLINAALGNIGSTVTLHEPALIEPQGDSLADLVTAMNAGEVHTLVILESNPVYTAPADIDFAGLLAQLPQTVHLSLYFNETSRACQWFLPAAHFLESWGDARAYDGTISFLQPLVRPLYDGRSPAEILAAFAGDSRSRGLELMRTYWRQRLPGVPSFQYHWEQSVQRGFIPDTAAPAATAEVQWNTAAPLVSRAAAIPARREMELGFEQSPKVYDGRFANNAWLLELPHPLTKLTWDNAAIISPSAAVRLGGVDSGDVVELRVSAGPGQDTRSVRAPVLVLPGHADDAVTLALGYGRSGEETLAQGIGVNAYPLRTSEDLHFTGGLTIEKTDDTYPLALTQEHWRLHGRDLVFQHTLSAYRQNPDFTAGHRGPVPSLLPRFVPEQAMTPDQWAMTIDTTICTGCGSCVVACQAENNIPVVGKEGVHNSREMYWLRIDRYFKGPADDPEVIHQPMLCQHCEKAPCEYVCPVNATVHSPDGLNEMVYNRCIGTRFCSNNCPYKVRRFNWFEYMEDATTPALQRNPDVTVRERGVMEKCTYCVQRIRRTQIQARIENREVRPNEVVTACQQACPTGAIQFGSLAHTDTDMVRWRRQPRAYAVLHDQGTSPRTMYLAKIDNPNPEMK